MRKVVIGVLLTVVTAVSYAAWPLVSAYQLRAAIRAGDTAAIDRRVEWPSLKSALRASLLEYGLPEESPAASASAAPGRRGLWQRVKSAAAPTLVDAFIERYVNAEGLPKLMQYRDTWRRWRGLPTDPAPPDATPSERLAIALDRVKRAAFLSPTRLDIEIADRHRPERSYLSTFELRGLEWKLTGLRILVAPPKAS